MQKLQKKYDDPEVVVGPDHHHLASYMNPELDLDLMALLRKNFKNIDDPEVVAAPDHHHPTPCTNPELDSNSVSSLCKNLKKNDDLEVVVGTDHHHPTSYTNHKLDSDLVALFRKKFKQKTKGKSHSSGSNNITWLGLNCLVVIVVSCSFSCRLPGTAIDGLQLIGLASNTYGSNLT